MTKISASPSGYSYPMGLAALHSQLSTAVIGFHEAVARRLGMSAAERKCLGLVGELGEVTPGQLAAATGLTTGAITGIVDRLARAGHVARDPNPADRRSFIVRPLRAAEHLAEAGEMFAPLTAAMKTLQARYSPEELRLIEDYLAQTTQVLKSETARLESGAPPGSRRSTGARQDKETA